MKSGKKIWSTVVDYFLILGAIIGVGFASGKEIAVFFFQFGSFSFVGIIAFAILYFYLFFVIQHIRVKLSINDYSEFNSRLFGRASKLTNIVLLINFSITASGMLAGADYLFIEFFGVGYKIPSIILSILTLLLIISGIDKIKLVSNIIVPIMICVIVINSLYNLNASNVNLPITNQNIFMAIYYGVLFGVNNFITAIPILLNNKNSSKTKVPVILTLCVVILLTVLALASSSITTEMPMVEMSKNISNPFYYVYLITLLFALFSTLVLCSYNMSTIINLHSHKFSCCLVVLFNLILSNLGYKYIIGYLYVLSGIICFIYILALVVLGFINLIKTRNHKNN